MSGSIRSRSGFMAVLLKTLIWAELYRQDEALLSEDTFLLKSGAMRLNECTHEASSAVSLWSKRASDWGIASMEREI
jgi:hypothetical protein